MMIGSDADRVALPILPPSISKARQYFFQKIRTSATAASNDIKHAVNRTADGKTRYYITTAVLISYAKSWKKQNNSRASQELTSNQLTRAAQTRDFFQLPISHFQISSQHLQSLSSRCMEYELSDTTAMPQSLSTELAMSRARDMFEPMPVLTDSNFVAGSEPQV
jgi:hypothetical protein